MSKIVVPRGIQGSGKSTFSLAWVMEDPKTRVRINMDDLRRMSGQYWVPSREGYIKTLKEFAVKEALQGGYDVVLDNMNLSVSEMDWITRISKKFSADIEYHEFFIPLEECIKRDSQRESPIGEKIIRETYERNKGVLSVDTWIRDDLGELTKTPPKTKEGFHKATLKEISEYNDRSVEAIL